mmetsp:Transcript_11133/g.28179  ORF Transcript_11133/g.28179 Transcript_11133/m.28179 type:complete len:485 (-) Transcript_11133:297-1751(-)
MDGRHCSGFGSSLSSYFFFLSLFRFLAVSLHGNEPFIDELGWPSHNDVVVLAPPPLNLQRPSWNVNEALVLQPSLKHAGHDHAARTRAAGQRLSRAALPVHHLHRIRQVIERLWRIVQGSAKVGVDLFWKSGVLLEERAVVIDIEVVDVEDPAERFLARPAEGDGVGVAHADAGDEPPLLQLPLGPPRDVLLHALLVRGEHLLGVGNRLHFAADLELLKHHRARVVLALPRGRQRRRNLRSLQPRLAHIHAHQPIGIHLGNDRAGEGVELVGPRHAVLLKLGHEAGQAADAVAAHLRLRPIRVVHAHRVVVVRAAAAGGVGVGLVAGAARWWVHEEDDAVAADAEAPVAERDRLLAAEDGLARVAVVHHDEVVAEALVLVEVDGARAARVRVAFLGRHVFERIRPGPQRRQQSQVRLGAIPSPAPAQGFHGGATPKGSALPSQGRGRALRNGRNSQTTSHTSARLRLKHATHNSENRMEGTPNG